MGSIELIKASDGSGNAQTATVQSTRAPLASTIIVDTVAGINDTFTGSMGTPHTFVDPITSEELTVISEATAVDFSGHVDGSNLEIDDIAPGYTDLGSEIGDIIVIRPTTQWADNVAEVLDEVHEDDGSLKEDVVSLPNLDSSLQSGWFDADEAWSYASFATNTGTITVPSDATLKYSLGMRIRIVQSTGGTKYGIITKIASTLLTVYFGTAYTLNNEAITAPFYSMQKIPFGFPASPIQWSVEVSNTSDCGKTSPAQNTWYGDTGLSATGPSIAIPIGVWRVQYTANLLISENANGDFHVAMSLSTSASSETDTGFSTQLGIRATTDGVRVTSSVSITKEKFLALTAGTTYYLVIRTTDSGIAQIDLKGDNAPTVIRAVCAYL